ncbi:MAG: HAMP domain-containing protein [bacterium]|nr:HAMP domain-containing protein [bacterium]
MKIFLKEKFLIAILVLALVPLLAVSLLSYFSARKSLMESIKNYNEVLIHGMGIAIEDTVLSYKDLLESIGDNIDYFETIEEKKDFILKSKEKYPYNIKFLAVLDKLGKEIIRSDDNPLEDKSNRSEFYQVREKNYYLAWLSFNPVVDMPTVIISVPLFFEDKFQGALVSEIFLSDIWGKVMTGFTSPKDNIYLLTKEGRSVAEILATAEDFRSEDLREVAKNFASEEAVFLKEIDTKVGKLLAIADYLPALNWELVVFRPISEIYKPTLILGQRVIAIVFLTLFFIFIATIFLSKLIVEPIRKLHKGAEIIGKGNLDYKVDIRTGDEIEQLAKEFNRMAEDLRKSHAALEEAKSVLEIKVQARTKELKELTERQEEIIKERTKDLQEKMKELEKFNRLAIGRELKMIELKEEIKELKEELERTQRPNK